MKLSIIIPARNEKLLKWTLGNFHAACPDADVVVVDDTPEGIGVAQARDTGILQAKNRACLILDAHCNCWQNHPWPEILMAHAEEYPQDFGCCTCVVLRDPDRLEMHGHWITSCGRRRFRQHNRYHGARVQLQGEDVFGHRVFNTRWNVPGNLPDRIHRGHASEIACPLGGAYLINRDWYLDGLKRPWQGMKGWGASEISLALPNWLLGGRNVLLPAEIGHVFRREAPYETLIWQLLYNQFRLLAVLPIEDKLRTELRDHLRGDHWSEGVWQEAEKQLWSEPTWPEYQKLLASAPRTFTQWLKTARVN